MCTKMSRSRNRVRTLAVHPAAQHRLEKPFIRSIQSGDTAGVFMDLGRESGGLGTAVASAVSPPARQKRAVMDLHPISSRDPRTDTKGLGILARSLFRQMRAQGYSPEQIVGLSAELIQLVREDLAASVSTAAAE
ncbi:MAG: hypothetical protein IAG13_10400 [Deltaproteobacteria bacterium]|nr:hypothetical protein [Nannocystaceae bacterium]